ncbi:MAG: hypothetical protein ACTSRS_19785 [Candidatus Helarchaeota archaeon]
MKIHHFIIFWYVFIIVCFIFLFIISYFKILFGLHFLLGGFLCFSIITLTILPTLIELYNYRSNEHFRAYPNNENELHHRYSMNPNVPLLSQLALLHAFFYSISLTLGILYLNFLVPMGLVDGIVQTILIIPFFFLMWPFRSGIDILWKHFRKQLHVKETLLERKNLSEKVLSKLQMFYVFIVFSNFAISLYFLGQFSLMSVNVGNVIRALFIFFGGDFILIMLFENLHKYWHEMPRTKLAPSKSSFSSKFLTKKFYKFIIIPTLLAILLISSFILLPYLFIPDIGFLYFFIFYIGFKIVLIIYFFYRDLLIELIPKEFK